MVVNIGKISAVNFCAVEKPIGKNNNAENLPKITELSPVTPDFNVCLPQQYKQISIRTLSNGLNVYKYKLANGLSVSIVPMENAPTTVKNYVNVGSLNETDDIKGISHFLEHMAFNGTLGNDGYVKLLRGDSFNKIEELGGWTNASTGYALTDYVNSTPMLNEDDLEKQIKIIAAMSEDLELSESMIEKEKSPVSSEIDMVLDNPETVAIDQTVRTLYGIKSSADELVAGSIKHIKSFDKDDVRSYYNKYYTPDNMHLVITGDINPQDTIELVAKSFHSDKKANSDKYETPLKPISEMKRKDFVSDKSLSSTVILGFEGAKASDSKSNVILDIVNEYFHLTDTKIDSEARRLNTYFSLSDERISSNPNNPKINFISFDCADEKTEEALSIIINKIANLKSPDEETLKKIKSNLKDTHSDALDYSLYINNQLGASHFYDDCNSFFDYEKILDSVTEKDVENFIKQYLNVNKAAITVVHPAQKPSVEDEKYLSFKGKNRQPINPDKLSDKIIPNNYTVAYVETNNNNTPFSLMLNYKFPENFNPAARLVLNDIYSHGTFYTEEDDFNKFQEDKNVGISVSVGKNSLNLSVDTNADNFDKAANKAMELLYNPRINEEEFHNAVEKLKERILLSQESAYEIYLDHVAKTNSYYTSTHDMLKALDTLTIDEVKELHKYIMNKSGGTIVVNIPEKNHELKKTAEQKFSQLKNVKLHKYDLMQQYKENKKPVVLTKDRNVSQADINQIYLYKASNDDREKIIAKLMNSILSSSDSIGLFNSLRERDHLAYSVYSNIESIGDRGELSLNILTSTDNKDTQTYTFDNVQKSVNGFKRQITALLNSEYTDKDLDIAKMKMKAAYLNKEGVYTKLFAVESAMYESKPLDNDNKIFNLIDSITREEIDNFAQKVFANPPIYSIVASKDTLKYNENFFKELSDR